MATAFNGSTKTKMKHAPSCLLLQTVGIFGGLGLEKAEGVSQATPPTMVTTLLYGSNLTPESSAYEDIEPYLEKHGINQEIN